MSAWVEIHTDGTVRIYNPADEMGQGSMTAMAAIIAEEMDADWDSVKIEYSPVVPEIYGSLGWGSRRMITVGSRTVMTYYEMLREAGAQVRQALIRTVAEHWQVEASELSSSEGKISHAPSGKEISYGEIAGLDSLATTSSEVGKENWKDPGDFKIIGKYIPRYDIPEKLNGQAQYVVWILR